MANKKPEVGHQASDFTLKSFSEDEIKTIKLSELTGKVVVLAFYPKDNTPGCTREMCAFRDDWAKFNQKGIRVFGVSQDSIISHEKFSKKFEMGSLELLSDQDGKMSEAYSVGIEYPKRTLFVIDKNGKIAKIHEGMPKNNELLEFCESLL
jgi:thioredoxin-dependent peroxiredoxin